MLKAAIAQREYMCHTQKRGRFFLLNLWSCLSHIFQAINKKLKSAFIGVENYCWLVFSGLKLRQCCTSCCITCIVVYTVLSSRQHPLAYFVSPVYVPHPDDYHSPLHLTLCDWDIFLMLCLFPQCVITAAQVTCIPTGRWSVSSQKMQCECLQQSWDALLVSMNTQLNLLTYYAVIY